MRQILGVLGRLTLMLASMAFLTGLGLLVLGSWLATFPILRLSPRERRMRAGINLAGALFAAGQAFAPPTTTNDELNEP